MLVHPTCLMLIFWSWLKTWFSARELSKDKLIRILESMWLAHAQPQTLSCSNLSTLLTQVTSTFTITSQPILKATQQCSLIMCVIPFPSSNLKNSNNAEAFTPSLGFP
ncbi:hypothetical protein VNO80_13569 [Phaseolus coccineus]|uniref:Uncharacterized protein n=1 Tax=Phaseolus coccineus TaxID=3886 RepID=A0AAN9N179_PHACN